MLEILKKFNGFIAEYNWEVGLAMLKNDLIGIIAGIFITWIGYFYVKDLYNVVKTGLKEQEAKPAMFLAVLFEILTSFSTLGYLLSFVGGILITLISIYSILF